MDLEKLKQLAARKRSIIRVFGKLDVHFFSINPEGEVDSPAVEMITEDKLSEFFSDALANAETFHIEGRLWKRRLNRQEMQRILDSSDK